jgi:hypothetical protein
MKLKITYKTCIALILYIGFGLSGANATLLVIDWTGECDDCQGSNGANSVPLEHMNDGYSQTVFGQLIVNYAGSAEEQGTLTNKNFVSFYYGGSNILDSFTFTTDNFTADTEFSTTITSQVDGTLNLSGFSLTKLSGFTNSNQWTNEPSRDLLSSPDHHINLMFESVLADGSGGGWSIGVTMVPSTVAPPSFTPPSFATPASVYDGLLSASNCLPGSALCWNTPNPNAAVASTQVLGGCEWGFAACSDVGDGVKYTKFTEVPEPSSIAIFALGIMGLASRRFKKQS